MDVKKKNVTLMSSVALPEPQSNLMQGTPTVYQPTVVAVSVLPSLNGPDPRAGAPLSL